MKATAGVSTLATYFEQTGRRFYAGPFLCLVIRRAICPVGICFILIVKIHIIGAQGLSISHERRVFNVSVFMRALCIGRKKNNSGK